MNVGSLFSGVGGLDLGLHRAGMSHVFFCESDEWRRQVLAEHWPGVPIYEDVRDVQPSRPGRGGEAGDGHVGGIESSRRLVEPVVHLLCGGFPCQDVSVAGRRAGLAGERSGLFHEFTRIANALRPRWLLVENVPGLFSSNGGRDFGVVLGTLADLGYGLAWRVLDSRFFGVPQRRRRVFIVGALAERDSRAAAERAGQVLAVGSRCPRHFPSRGEARLVAPALVKRYGKGADSDATDALVTAFHATQDPISGHVTPAMSKEESGALAVHTGPLVRRLTPTECERLQALPDGWTAFGADSKRYAALGDAVTASVAEWIGRRMQRKEAA